MQHGLLRTLIKLCFCAACFLGLGVAWLGLFFEPHAVLPCAAMPLKLSFEFKKAPVNSIILHTCPRISIEAAIWPQMVRSETKQRQLTLQGFGEMMQDVVTPQTSLLRYLACFVPLTILHVGWAEAPHTGPHKPLNRTDDELP